MNEKAVLVSWKEAAEKFERQHGNTSEVSDAVACFEKIIECKPQQGYSKLSYNVAILYRILGNARKSMQNWDACIERDPYSCMAYFQRGNTHFQLKNYTDAARDYQKSIQCMRQATVIDYSQLGLKCKLFQHEVIYNEAVCHIMLGSKEKCLEALNEAESLANSDTTRLLNTIDITSTINSIKSGSNTDNMKIVTRGDNSIYLPPAAKLKNLDKKNYLGAAKVVSSVEAGDTFSGFTGPLLLAEPPPDRPSSPRPRTPLIQRKETPPRPSSPVIKPRATPPIARVDLPKAHSSTITLTVPATNKENKPTASSTSLPSAVNEKPGIPVKPDLCQVELIAGDDIQYIIIPFNTNYIKLTDLVAKKYGYTDGTFTLWYLNRAGTYTIIDNQDIVNHVWKWKVNNSKLSIYVFGV